MTNPQYYKSAIDGSGCISNAWELIKTNYWLYLGMTFVSGLILVALSFIPIVGIVAVAPLTGGLYFAYLRAMRGEYVDFGMLFKGFEKFVPLLIIGLVQGIPSIIVQILQLFLNLASLATAARREAAEPYSYRVRSQFRTSLPLMLRQADRRPDRSAFTTKRQKQGSFRRSQSRSKTRTD